MLERQEALLCLKKFKLTRRLAASCQLESILPVFSGQVVLYCVWYGRDKAMHFPNFLFVTTTYSYLHITTPKAVRNKC